MATIRDIAKLAEVSPATVSRVLNNHANVNDDTRDAVMRAVEELDYPLENLRQTPRNSKSVLVLTRDTTMPTANGGAAGREFERSVWGGVNAYFVGKGIAARLQSTGIASADALKYASDKNISGLVLLGGVIDPEFVTRLKSLDIPLVIAGAHLYGPGVSCVMADVFDGMRQAVRHLIEEADRQDIGFVNSVATTETSQYKQDAFHLELSRHDLPFRPDRIAISDFEAASGYEATHALLEQHPGLDAIAYADDVIAMGGLKAIRETGRRVPHDLATTGFGDYELAQFVDPNLTTVHYDMYAMGQIAARRLSMLMTEPDSDPWFNLVPASLVRRDSA